jgi:pimeloyl-ACP methyl ester carboxylesterase
VLTTFDAGDGRTLSYTRRGTGPLVVCIPGGPGMDPEAYFSDMDLPGYETLIFAPRGTGASSRPGPPDAYRIADHVADVEELRQHLDLEQLTIYGNSHGGCVALAYASTYPERVARLIVINAPHSMGDGYLAAATDARERFKAALIDGEARLQASDDAWLAIAKARDETERQRLFRIFMERYVARLEAAETGYLDRLCSAPMNFESVDVMSSEFQSGLELLDGAGAVEAPTLVTGSEYDVTVPAPMMRALAAALPYGQYVEFADIGHFPEVEAGPAFTNVMLEFLRS